MYLLFTYFFINAPTFICSMFYPLDLLTLPHPLTCNIPTRSFPNLRGAGLVQLGPRTVTSPTTFTQPSFGQIDLIKGYYVPFSIHCIFSLTLMT